jgi:hypothetical protein
MLGDADVEVIGMAGIIMPVGTSQQICVEIHEVRVLRYGPSPRLSPYSG